MWGSVRHKQIGVHPGFPYTVAAAAAAAAATIASP